MIFASTSEEILTLSQAATSRKKKMKKKNSDCKLVEYCVIAQKQHFVLYQIKYLPRDAIIQADNPASGYAPEVGGATAGRGWGSCEAGSMLIAVASLCQSVSMLSALALHSITHSLIHLLTHSIAHSLTHCSSSTDSTDTVSPAFHSTQQHCPLLVRPIRHLDKMMSHLKNDYTEQFLTLGLSH